MSKIVAIATIIAMSTLSSASVDFDLTNIEYNGTEFTEIGSVASDLGGLQVGSISVLDGIIETFNNTGSPNIGSDAFLAIGLELDTGEDWLYYFFPFPDDFSDGTFGPADTYIDLSGDNFYFPEDGVITAYAANTWNDETGDPSGEWLGGILSISAVPAPGSIGLLLCATFSTRRRRRH